MTPPRATTTTAAGWIQIVLSAGWVAFGIFLVFGGLAMAGAFGSLGEALFGAVDEGGPAGLVALPAALATGIFGWVVGLAAAAMVVAGMVVSAFAMGVLALAVGVLRRSRAARIATLVLASVFTLFSFGAVFGEAPDEPDWVAEVEGGGETPLDAPAQDDPFGGGFEVVPDQPAQDETAAQAEPEDAGGGPVAVLWMLGNVAVVVLLLLPATRADFKGAAQARRQADEAADEPAGPAPHGATDGATDGDPLPA